MQPDQWQGRWREKAFSNTPRAVPLSVRLCILLGGFLPQLGWVFVGFGGMIVWIFGGTQALHNLVFFSSELREVEGTVVSVVNTNFMLNEQPIYAYHYTYEVGAVSCDGVTKALGGAYEEGDAVLVEYAVADPDRSRIRGLAINMALDLCIVPILPIVGLCFITVGVRKRIKGARLLRHGEMAVGKLIGQKPTNKQVNGQTVYIFTFRFTAADKQSYKVVAKSHMRESFSGEDPEDLPPPREGDKPSGIREPLLYNPKDPHDAVLLDDLPGEPRINERGHIKSRRPAGLMSLIIPGLTILGHGTWLLHVLEVF